MENNLFTIDPGHSAVGFSVRHLMITNVRGEFEKFSGTITYDAIRPEATRIEATIDVASVNTRQAQRDSDLRGELFFDVAHHPTMRFVTKSARIGRTCARSTSRRRAHDPRRHARRHAGGARHQRRDHRYAGQ